MKVYMTEKQGSTLRELQPFAEVTMSFNPFRNQSGFYTRSHEENISFVLKIRCLLGVTVGNSLKCRHVLEPLVSTA